MRTFWTSPALLGPVLLALAALPGSVWCQVAPDPAAPFEDLPALPEASDSPLLECYHRARGIAGRPGRAVVQQGSDAYACDLAVQMARDSGSRTELAAALVNRALLLAADGRPEPALEDLNAALQQTPDDPAIYGTLGNLLLRLERPADALAAHGRAVDLAPSDPRGYYNRAFSYRALGEPARAEQDVAAARSLLERRRAPVRAPETPAPGGDRFR